MKSPERSRAYIDYYNKGLLTKKELVSLTVPMRDFLARNNISLPHVQFGIAADRFGKDGSILAFPHGRSGKGRVYRVDTEIASFHIADLKTFTRDINKEKYPERTQEEKERFQRQLLRIKHEDGSYSPITQDEAFAHLLRKGKQMAIALGWPAEAEDLAMDVVLRVLPYLQGERGDFPDFFHFRKYYTVGLRNSLTDAHRRRISEKNAIEHYVQEAKEDQAIIPQGDISNEEDRSFELSWQHALARLPLEEDIQLFLRRNLYRTPWKIIARETGVASGVLRKRYHHILKSIKEGKIRRTRPDLRTVKPKEFQQTETEPMSSANKRIIAAYDEFSRNFIQKNGRKPKYKDMVNARREGTFPYTIDSLRLRFGNGDLPWDMTRAKMERLLEQEKQSVPSK